MTETLSQRYPAEMLPVRMIPLTKGRFDDIEEAARVRDAATIELHGEFARLNFPMIGQQRKAR